MSLTSKITLGASCLVTFGTIAYVHLKQEVDKQRLHQGVIRDIETQRRRKIENVLVLQKQKDLQRHLENIRENEVNVNDS